MKADEVRSREDLVRFLTELSGEVRAGRVTVANATTADLLESASGWVEDMDGYFLHRGEEVPSAPSWQLIAMIFDASLVYE